jgi:hypothetical protein
MSWWLLMPEELEVYTTKECTTSPMQNSKTNLDTRMPNCDINMMSAFDLPHKKRKSGHFVESLHSVKRTTDLLKLPSSS